MRNYEDSEDSGYSLKRLPENDKKAKTLAKLLRGPEEFMVIELDEFKGHSFLNFKILKKSEGKWSVRKDKGITIKIKELAQLKAAVQEAIDRTEVPF